MIRMKSSHTVDVFSSRGFNVVVNEDDTESPEPIIDDRVQISGDGQSSGSVYTLTPIEGFEGNVLITVNVTDNGEGQLTDTETFKLWVTNDNAAPELLEIDDQSVLEDETLDFTIAFTDEDVDDVHRVSVSSNNNAILFTGEGNASPTDRTVAAPADFRVKLR